MNRVTDRQMTQQDMPENQAWAAVDRYFGESLIQPEPDLDLILRANAAAGLPPYDVTPAQGKLLYLLARLCKARRILEIGTLGGYSTAWLARALPHDGSLTTLELDPMRAEVALSNLKRAGVASQIELRTGDALKTMAVLRSENCLPFDFIFIDADKQRTAEYCRQSLKLSRPGTMIVVDNVVRNGAVADASSTDPDVQGIRGMVDYIRNEPRLDATALQTVAGKGYDGFLLAMVNEV